jgi:hypothetical protein
MRKYKFIITLDKYTQVDSAEEIEGHVSWPNYSQAGPVHYRGVFDTYEEAKEYASNFSLYKYVTNDGYDSSDDYETPYFISIFDAEDALCALMGVEPGDAFCVHPDSYTVEEITEEDTENDIPAGVYKYRYIYKGECVYDSVDEDGDYYDSYDEAREAAESYMEDYEIQTDEYPCDWLYPIEAEKVEIMEFDDEEE